MKNTNIMKLEDLCKKVKNGASSFYLKEGTVPLRLVRHADVGEDGTVNAATAEAVMARDTARTTGNLLKADDVLVAIRGPMKVAVVPPEVEGYAFSAEFSALEIDTEKIRPEIIAAYLRMPHVNSYLERRSSGKIMRSVSLQDILDLEIAVPDWDTQNTIAELLSLMSEHRKIMKEEESKLTELATSLMILVEGGSRP